MQEAVLTFAEIISGARIIPLSNGKLCFVDAEDFELASSMTWRCNNGYAVRHIRSSDDERWTALYLHRLLMSADKGVQVDHRSGNRLDCRRFNLRRATHSQNQRNKGLQKNNTSGYKGVRFNIRANRWKAQIKVNGKMKHCGYHSTAESAYAAYCKAAEEFHGEFARIK